MTHKNLRTQNSLKASLWMKDDSITQVSIYMRAVMIPWGLFAVTMNTRHMRVDPDSSLFCGR